MKKLKSQRLIFSKIDESDFSFFNQFLSDKDSSLYLPFGRPYSLEEIKEYMKLRLSHWQKHNFGLFTLKAKGSDDPIGYCGLEYANNTEYVDIRYGIIKDEWRKGYAKEAAIRCLEFGFYYINLPEIYGVSKKDNNVSISILKKIGMKEDRDVDFYNSDIFYFKIKNRNI